jgi:predicted ATPase
LAAFERLASALREELGREPSPAVGVLERSMRTQDPALDPPSRVAAAPHVTRAPAATTFVGREAELVELDAAVEGNRRVAIVGPAGTGKTRLAAQLCHRIGDRFRDGTAFVELGMVRAPELVATHIATRLGLVDSAETGTVEPPQLLAGYLRDREMLLVLDGCEPVLGVVASLVGELHEQCRSLRIVTTARDPLQLGEAVVTLGPMDTPRVGASDAELTHNDAVRLYLERGVQPEPTGSADLAAIGELTRLIGGNPLAIELVAGLTGVVAPSTILDRAREMLAPPSRRASLRTTFALSHERLTDDQRTLFRRAGVFAAGFGLTALQAVAGADGLDPSRVATELAALESSALVYPMGHARDRRRMLDTVRDESLERLRAAGELDATFARQTTYYVQLAERCDLALRGHGQDEARDTLDLELDNLRDVLDRLLAVGDGETAARLTAALGDYWYLRGHWAEARRWVDRCVAATDGSRTLARAQVLRSSANQAGFSGISDRMAQLEAALAIVREHESPEDEIWVLLFMAGAVGSAGDHARMHELVADADWLIAQLDDPWTRAVRRSYIAATDATLDPVDARDEQLRAHRELLVLGDRAWAGRCLWFAGSLARKHHLATAELELDEAIRLCEAAGDRAATAHARASLTRALLARGDPDAQTLFERSVEELAAIGDSHCAEKLRAAMLSGVGAR